MKFSTAAVIAAVTLGLFAILGYLNVNHVDVSTYMYLIPTALPAIAALFGVSRIGGNVNTIRTNTNGTLSALNAAKAASDAGLMHALAILTPEQASAVLAAMSGNPAAAAAASLASPTITPPAAPAAPLPVIPVAVAPAPVEPLPVPAAAPVALPASPLGTFIPDPAALA